MSSSFAAGFFGQLNNDIVDRKQYIRTRVEEDRLYLREQGLKRQAGVQEQRQDYEKIARSLINRGGDESLIISTLEMDPAGLMQVYTQAERDNTTGNGINDMMSIAEDNRSTSSMQEVLDRILPTIQEMPANTDPVTSRRRSLGAFLGLDLDAELSNEVYNSEIIAGMTGDQIMSSLNLPIDAQGSNVGGVTFDLSGPTATLSAQDRNTYLRGIMDSYNLPARIDALKASKEGKTGIELESIDARIKTLEGINAMPSGQGFNSIVSLIGQEGYEDLTLSQYTTDIAKEPYGPQVFMAPGIFPEVRERLMGSPATPRDTSEDNETKNGLGAAQTPDEDTIRPQTRPIRVPEGAPKFPTAGAAEEALALLFTETDEDEIIVLIAGEPKVFRREELPVLTLGQSEDRTELLALSKGEDKGAYEDVLRVFLDTYGPERTEAFLVANDPLNYVPSELTPAEKDEYRRDKDYVITVLNSEKADPEDLELVISAFRQAYGDVATDNLINQEQIAR